MNTIDLSFDEIKIGTQIKTKKGFIWTLLDRDESGQTWKDETSGLTWLPEENGQFNHNEAMKIECDSKRLPTKEEFKAAEKHGIREILNMKNKWFWSASVHPNYSDIAYDFDVSYGGIYYGYRDSGNGSVRCVRNGGVK